MCRVKNIGGFLLAVLTQLLILFGNYCANKCVILYWFYDGKSAFELTFIGKVHYIFFNFLCLMACVSHVRSCMSDPGTIPKDIEFPDFVETSLL